MPGSSRTKPASLGVTRATHPRICCYKTLTAEEYKVQKNTQSAECTYFLPRILYKTLTAEESAVDTDCRKIESAEHPTIQQAILCVHSLVIAQAIIS